MVTLCSIENTFVTLVAQESTAIDKEKKEKKLLEDQLHDKQERVKSLEHQLRDQQLKVKLLEHQLQEERGKK